MKAIQSLLLILVDFRSATMGIAGDIILVHIEIITQIHSPYLQEDNTSMFEGIETEFRLCVSNHFLLLE